MEIAIKFDIEKDLKRLSEEDLKKLFENVSHSLDIIFKDKRSSKRSLEIIDETDSTNNVGYNPIIYESPEEACKVLKSLYECLGSYQKATVYDLFYISEMSCDSDYMDYGWKNLNNATITAVGDCWTIELPFPIKFEKEKEPVIETEKEPVIETYYFHNMNDLADIFLNMKATIIKTGYCTVADFYDMADENYNYSTLETKYGWTDLENSIILYDSGKDAYYIKFQDPIYLESDLTFFRQGG